MATVLHKENGRMSSARNFGVKHAKGNIIVALDSDDYFEASFFEKGLKVLDANPEVAVVTSHMKMFGKDNKISKPRGGDQYNFLFSSECPACAMVRKSCWDAVGGYDESMTLGYEDWEFYIRITQQNWTVHVIKEVLFFYRQTEKSTHKNKTLPNRKIIIQYILNKHQDWYLRNLAALISENKIIYTERRTAYNTILKLFVDRITHKFN
jgi:GT2 family glycosyltransferase